MLGNIPDMVQELLDFAVRGGASGSGGAGMRRQQWPGSDPGRNRQHSSSQVSLAAGDLAA